MVTVNSLFILLGATVFDVRRDLFLFSVFSISNAFSSVVGFFYNSYLFGKFPAKINFDTSSKPTTLENCT